jgi:hypothetical protein
MSTSGIIDERSEVLGSGHRMARVWQAEGLGAINFVIDLCSSKQRACHFAFRLSPKLPAASSP